MLTCCSIIVEVLDSMRSFLMQYIGCITFMLPYTGFRRQYCDARIFSGERKKERRPRGLLSGNLICSRYHKSVSYQGGSGGTPDIGS